MLSKEGKVCPQCEDVVHLACEPADKCSVCDQPYQPYEPACPDPLPEALLPRALRPPKSAGPALAIAALIAFAVLSITAWYVTEQLMSHEH